MKKFTVINEEFICKNCEALNSKLSGSCRNHCCKCLYSMHVDEKYPGDRKSNCHGLMQPLKIAHSGKKGWIIYHKCTQCKKIIPNKSAEDDDFEAIIKIAANTETSRNMKPNRK